MRNGAQVKNHDFAPFKGGVDAATLLMFWQLLSKFPKWPNREISRPNREGNRPKTEINQPKR